MLLLSTVLIIVGTWNLVVGAMERRNGGGGLILTGAVFICTGAATLPFLGGGIRIALSLIAGILLVVTILVMPRESWRLVGRHLRREG
jgi:hypothetical protein